MNELTNFWAQWLRPSAGLPTVQWALLLAVATVAGYLVQHRSGLPKVVGYTLVGTAAGLAGFGGAAWPLQGIGLFLVAVVLFEAGGQFTCPIDLFVLEAGNDNDDGPGQALAPRVLH